MPGSKPGAQSWEVYFLTHGEPSASISLGTVFERDLPSVIVPEIGECYELPAGNPARRLETGRTDLRGVIGRDWQNEYADFAANLKRDLLKIADADRRRRTLAQVRALLDGTAN